MTYCDRHVIRTVCTLDTVVHNSHVLFANQCLMSCNKIVQLFSPRDATHSAVMSREVV